MKIYTIKKIFLTTKHIELVDRKEFTAIALNLEYETLVDHVVSFSSIASLSSFPLGIHPSRKPQIANLIVKKALTKIPNKYVDFPDVFSLNLASKLLEYTEINNHAIKLVGN